jgi:multiple sugar transport system permease protein
MSTLTETPADAGGGVAGRTRSRRGTAPRRGLSDRALAWIFVTPVVLLLIAINIFPLLWNVWLSFTNFRANRPGMPVRWMDTANYERLLSQEDVWWSLQATAHFVTWSIVFQVLIGFTLAWLINKNFRGGGVWTTLIVLPMMLSPAVVGTFWTYLFQPQTGIFNAIVGFFTGSTQFSMIADANLAPWAIVLVDTWMWTPFVMLICLAGLRSVPRDLYEAAEVDGASPLRQFWTITLPMVLPFLMLAVLFRGIENFKMFDMVVELTSGGPGSVTELANIYLKREAFEKWRTGYAAALAVILFVTVFGFANIYVKVWNRVKQR